MKLKDLPLAERTVLLRQPQIKAAIMAEASLPHELPGTMENVVSLMQPDFERTFSLADGPEYEPSTEQS